MPARIFRGRAGTVAADHAVSERLLSVAADGDPAIRVWTPHRQAAFGRRDARLEGRYDRARTVARECGFPPVERHVGGRAVVYDGETTLAFARAEPVSDLRVGLRDRYERLTGDVERALRRLGVDAERGEPPDSFCPGSHSLSAPVGSNGRGNGKLVGIAQRVRSDAALVAGVLLVDHDPVVGAYEAVYDALGVPFDPDAVGSIAAAGGPTDPDRIRRALEDALVSARSRVEEVDVDGAGDRGGDGNGDGDEDGE